MRPLHCVLNGLVLSRTTPGLKLLTLVIVAWINISPIFQYFSEPRTIVVFWTADVSRTARFMVFLY